MMIYMATLIEFKKKNLFLLSRLYKVVFEDNGKQISKLKI